MLPGDILAALRLHVFITADAVGGVWTYATDLAAGLAARGATLTLAVVGPHPADHQIAAAERIPRLRLRITGLPLDWVACDPPAVMQAGTQLAALAKGADIVHLHSPAFAAGAPFAAPVVGVCHSCPATWWGAVHGGALPPQLAWRRDVLAEGYRCADRLLAPSAAFAVATASLYGVAPPCVVHNGRALPAAADTAAGSFVFTAGRLWDAGKGMRTLDAAAALLPYAVLAAGPLQGEDGSRIAFKHLQTPGRLSAADMARHFAARPVFACAARYEPFGLAVLEAAQAGCALVLSDIGSFRELWGEAADYAPVGDAAAFASAIARLMEEPSTRARRGAAAQARAARYTVEAMVDGTLALYREALAA